MGPTEFKQLLEQSWRRPLSPEEEAQLQAYLSANPQWQAVWSEDQQMTRFLQQLPDAPISSNFTAQIWQKIDRLSPAAPGWTELAWWRAWRLPQAAGALLAALVLSAGAYLQFAKSVRVSRARGIAEVSTLTASVWGLLAPAKAPALRPTATPVVAVSPDADTLQDFELIRSLSLVDRGLLQNLQ